MESGITYFMISYNNALYFKIMWTDLRISCGPPGKTSFAFHFSNKNYFTVFPGKKTLSEIL